MLISSTFSVHTPVHSRSGFLIYLNRSTKTVTSTVAAWNGEHYFPSRSGLVDRRSSRLYFHFTHLSSSFSVTGWRSELFVAVGCDIDALLPALSDRTTTALALDASSDLKINFDLNNILPAPLVNNPCSPVTVTVAPALNTYLTQIASTRKEGRLQQRRNNANKQREFKRSHDLAALLAKESKGVRTDEAEAAELMRAAVERLDTTAGDLEVYLLSSTATKAERTAATLRRCKASRDDAEKARDKSIDTQCDWEAKNERKMNGMKSIERKLESKREEVNNLNDDILPLRAAYHPIAHYMPLHVHYISTANAILQQDVIDWEALNAQKAQRKVYLDQISLSQLPLLTEVNRLRSLHDWMVARYITWTAWKFDDYDEENEETEMKFEVDIDGDAIMA